jgi:hypothetical protein
LKRKFRGNSCFEGIDRVSVQGVQVLNDRDLEFKSIFESNLGCKGNSGSEVIGVWIGVEN